MFYFLLFFYIVIMGMLYRVSFGKYNKLTLFHLFYLSYVIAILLGLPSLDNDEHYYKLYVISALLTPLLILIGGVLGKIRCFPIFNQSKNYEQFNSILLHHSRVLLVSTVILFIIYILDVGFNSSGLIFAIINPGDSIAAMEIRQRALTSNISIIFTKLYGYSRAFIIPFICCLFITYRLERKITRIKLYCLVFLGVFYSAFSAAKAPVFYLFLCMALTYYWQKTYREPALARRYLLKFVIGMLIGLFISSLFYPLLHGVASNQAIYYAWDQLNERVFKVPGEAALAYFQIFGRSIDYLGWKGNSFLSLLMGEKSVSSAQLLYSYFYTNMFSDTGLMNGAFFAMLYADFGFYSIILGSMFIGYFIGQIQIFLDRLPINAISLSCRSVCSLAVMQLVLTDFTSTLMGRGLLLLPLLLFISTYLISCNFRK